MTSGSTVLILSGPSSFGVEVGPHSSRFSMSTDTSARSKTKSMIASEIIHRVACRLNLVKRYTQ